MSLIRTAKKIQEVDIIDYKETARILGLAEKTVANGGAGTHNLRIPWGPDGKMVRFKKEAVLKRKQEWLDRAA